MFPPGDQHVHIYGSSDAAFPRGRTGYKRSAPKTTHSDRPTVDRDGRRIVQYSRNTFKAKEPGAAQKALAVRSRITNETVMPYSLRPRRDAPSNQTDLQAGVFVSLALDMEKMIRRKLFKLVVLADCTACQSINGQNYTQMAKSGTPDVYQELNVRGGQQKAGKCPQIKNSVQRTGILYQKQRFQTNQFTTNVDLLDWIRGWCMAPRDKDEKNTPANHYMECFFEEPILSCYIKLIAVSKESVLRAFWEMDYSLIRCPDKRNGSYSEKLQNQPLTPSTCREIERNLNREMVPVTDNAAFTVTNSCCDEDFVLFRQSKLDAFQPRLRPVIELNLYSEAEKHCTLRLIKCEQFTNLHFDSTLQLPSEQLRIKLSDDTGLKNSTLVRWELLEIPRPL
ncbi:hypothetical protein T265_04597 [Opisthorchis viverrini]|uniref:Uncharacterized protein n=1 Tax=Opisthorchis viverrini TaxID=6198 RepID=A0A074ZNI4_OPIVI|nr:hypothetical protein T265_04597 [Opisthorchis viverrini]KER28646.1 hypothetical protein T265_04597 [Opisthorchis viverrini]